MMEGPEVVPVRFRASLGGLSGSPGVPGTSWEVLGHSWRVLGGFLGVPGRSRGRSLGDTWSTPGGSLGCLSLPGRSCGALGRPWVVLGTVHLLFLGGEFGICRTKY